LRVPNFSYISPPVICLMRCLVCAVFTDMTVPCSHSHCCSDCTAISPVLRACSPISSFHGRRHQTHLFRTSDYNSISRRRPTRLGVAAGVMTYRRADRRPRDQQPVRGPLSYRLGYPDVIRRLLHSGWVRTIYIAGMGVRRGTRRRASRFTID